MEASSYICATLWSTAWHPGCCGQHTAGFRPSSHCTHWFRCSQLPLLCNNSSPAPSFLRSSTTGRSRMRACRRPSCSVCRRAPRSCWQRRCSRGQGSVLTLAAVSLSLLLALAAAHLMPLPCCRCLAASTAASHPGCCRQHQQHPAQQPSLHPCVPYCRRRRSGCAPGALERNGSALATSPMRCTHRPMQRCSTATAGGCVPALAAAAGVLCRTMTAADKLLHAALLCCSKRHGRQRHDSKSSHSLPPLCPWCSLARRWCSPADGTRTGRWRL